MNKESRETPPNWAVRLFTWFCRRDLADHILGDLWESFEEDLDRYSPARARRRFGWEVLRLFRPGIIRKFEFPGSNPIYIAMFRNYLKVAARQLLRYKLFSGLNVFGLATSMSVCLLLIMILRDQFSYDQFHEKKSRIYRIISDLEEKNAPLSALVPSNASAPLPLAPELEAAFPGLESIARIVPAYQRDLKSEHKIVSTRGLWVEPVFLDMFSFGWQEGEISTALLSPFSIVLTEEIARQHFELGHVIGQEIEVGDLGLFQVTGIIPDPPSNSHIDFDFLLSFATLEGMEKAGKVSPLLQNWDNIYQSYIYLSLREDARPDELTSVVNELAEQQSQRHARFNFAFKAQPLADIVPSKIMLSNEIGFAFPIIAVYFLAGLGLLVMLTACFNYTNLSIARALKRAKEIGIRKVSGARRSQIAIQFLVEAVLIALVSLGIGIFMVELLIPPFFDLDPLVSEFFHVSRDLELYVTFLAFAVGVGLLAGFFPAFHLSRFQPVAVLKNLSGIKLFSRLTVRRALIVVQFSLSLIFILSTIILQRQQRLMLATDLGIKTQNIINVALQGNQYELFASQVRQLPEVTDVSGSLIIPAIGMNYATMIRQTGQQDSIELDYNQVTGNYLDNLELRLIAGQNFPANLPEEQDQFILLNQTAVKKLGLKTPHEAIGLTLEYKNNFADARWMDRPIRVMGVFEDFHYLDVSYPIGAYGLRVTSNQLSHANVAVRGSHLNETIKAMEQIWQVIDPLHDLDYSFFDEETAARYKHFYVLSRIVGFIGLLAIIIACLGLLGMVTYSVEGRIKEIGIRKVLGASEGNLIWKLSRGFLQLMGIAILIATPLAWFVNNIWLQNLAIRIIPGPEVFLLGIGLILIMGMLTVIPQTYKAAITNPSEMLRDE